MFACNKRDMDKVISPLLASHFHHYWKQYSLVSDVSWAKSPIDRSSDTDLIFLLYRSIAFLGGQNVWFSDLPIQIQSSDCISRNSRLFQGLIFYRAIVTMYRFFNQRILFLALSSDFCIDIVSDSLKPIFFGYFHRCPPLDICLHSLYWTVYSTHACKSKLFKGSCLLDHVLLSF